MARVPSAASLGSKCQLPHTDCSVHKDVNKNVRKSSTDSVPAKTTSTYSNVKAGTLMQVDNTFENQQLMYVSSHNDGIETAPVSAAGLADKVVDNSILINTMQLAEPHVYKPIHVPDHLLETSMHNFLFSCHYHTFNVLMYIKFGSLHDCWNITVPNYLPTL